MDKYFNSYREMISLRGLTGHTLKSYSTYIRSYLDYLQNILHKSPEDVSWQDLRNYIKWLQKERNLSDRTVNAAISQLRFFTIYVLHKPWDDNQLPKRKFDEYLPFRFSLSYTRINSSGLLILHHIMLPDQHSDVVKHTGKNQ